MKFLEILYIHIVTAYTIVGGGGGGGGGGVKYFVIYPLALSSARGVYALI